MDAKANIQYNTIDTASILFSGNDDYQHGSSFPAFNFTGLDSINKPSGGNDMGGFGFNF